MMGDPPLEEPGNHEIEIVVAFLNAMISVIFVG